MFLQSQLPFVGLIPAKLQDGWLLGELSVRPEGASYSTLWYQVTTPSAQFRVKQFFQDNMEPSFPDTCIYAALGDAHQTSKLTYWWGTNYKDRDAYVLSLWKTQVEISIDQGSVEQKEMERFLVSLEPVDRIKANEILQKPFHELSFHARTGRGEGEIARCSHWTAPEKADLAPLTANLPNYWVLESVGIGTDEEQFVYWDPHTQVYALWVSRHRKRDYHPSASWTRNYSPGKQLGNFELYTHPQRGTVVYEDDGNVQTAYVFRGLPCTTYEQVSMFFALT